jgi:thiosulfate dehydrogenase
MTSRAAVFFVSFIAGGLALPAMAGATPAVKWAVPDMSRLPNDEWGKTVRYGHDLISKTASLIGPEVRDPHRRLSGNNLNCQSCHIDAGTRQFGLPLVGVYADFPNYRARSGAVGTIEDRIQGCMTRSMNGKPLPPDGAEMTAMVAYLKFLSTGIAVGAQTPGRGSGAMAELTRAADAVKGKLVYQKTCVACHGPNGAGQRAGKVGDAQGYSAPPLWGMDSFNTGAGMYRLIGAANFIHSNMPDGTRWNKPAISTTDAWDVAAYIESQPRPARPSLERDFPKRNEKPVDTPYGPYGDHAPVTQHKFGPFAPIRVASKAQRQK